MDGRREGTGRGVEWRRRKGGGARRKGRWLRDRRISGRRSERVGAIVMFGSYTEEEPRANHELQPPSSLLRYRPKFTRYDFYKSHQNSQHSQLGHPIVATIIYKMQKIFGGKSGSSKYASPGLTGIG